MHLWWLGLQQRQPCSKQTDQTEWRGELWGFSDSISFHHSAFPASVAYNSRTCWEQTTSAQSALFPIALAKTPGRKQSGWAWTDANHWIIQTESGEGGALKERRHFFPELEKRGRGKQQVFTLEGIVVVDICYPFGRPSIWTPSLFWGVSYLLGHLFWSLPPAIHAEKARNALSQPPFLPGRAHDPGWAIDMLASQAVTLELVIPKRVCADSVPVRGAATVWSGTWFLAAGLPRLVLWPSWALWATKRTLY